MSGACGCSGCAAEMGLALAATGTHPWANYLDQQIIDTRTTTGFARSSAGSRSETTPGASTFTSGVRGADRAVAVCDHLRGVLPTLLALSANSPFLDGHDTA